jgi:biotin carboxyl carrier protein
MLFDAVVDGRSVRVEVLGRDGRYGVRVDGRARDVDYLETGRHFASLLIDGRSYEVALERNGSGFKIALPGDCFEVQLQSAGRGVVAPARPAASGPARVAAPMPGKIVRLLVSAGQDVAAGQGLCVMEAMKMENELRAPRAGRVRELCVAEGQAVETGALLALLE